MVKLTDEFRSSWQGLSQPSRRFSAVVAVSGLALSTAARWIVAMIRPDIFFTPYIPAVILATAIGGLRVGTATALAGGALGVLVNFGPREPDSSRLALLLIYLVVCGLTICGIGHYREITSQQ